MEISSEELAVARKMRRDLVYFAEHNLWVKPKVGQLTKLKYNKGQLYFHNRCQDQLRRTGKVRQILVKGRQGGFSTYVASRFFHKTIWNHAILTFIFAHESRSSSALFDMVKRFYDNSDPFCKPVCSKSNAYELLFPKIESGYKVGTAGSGTGIGRGRTFQCVHWSEVAYSDKPHDLAAGILSTVPDLPGTEIILESTSNGQGDFFHDIVIMAGDGDYQDWEVTFIPWYWQDEYTAEAKDMELTDYETYMIETLKGDGLTKEHLAWRRSKLKSPEFNNDERKFKKEYPFTLEEAFEASDDESYIRAEELSYALSSQPIQSAYRPILGIDPAGHGKDEFGLVLRSGRNILDAKILPNEDDNEKYCDHLARYINDKKPILVNIDTIGLGIAIYDGLKRRGFGDIIKKVNTAERADRPELYANKRAELHAKKKEWLNDHPCAIVIVDQQLKKQLAQETTYARAKYNNNNALQIEKKEEIVKRHKVSPALSDSFDLTFANEIAAQEVHNVNRRAQVIHTGIGFDPFA